MRRFWEKVAVGDPAACWPWQGARTSDGYGSFRMGRRKVAAHRLAYELAVGEIPARLSILHGCDNPPCCNPAHLEPGTHADNMRQKRERSRARALRGDAHPQAKLTADSVREARRRWICGEPAAALAAANGVGEATMHNALHRKSWQHVQ